MSYKSNIGFRIESINFNLYLPLYRNNPYKSVTYAVRRSKSDICLIVKLCLIFE